MKKQIIALATCIFMGFSSITSYAYSAEVCQGNTANADDVKAFYSNLSSKGYAVTAKGYSDKGITIADKNDFINAKNYNVLYWSGHGGSNGNNATLNITHDSSKRFNTFEAADKWKNTYDLKVAIIAACYQFNGNGLRGKWVEIMKNSGLKVLAGYHESAPSSNDTKIANEFFRLANETRGSSQGNSVRYSWQQANIANGSSGKWIVLGYKTNRMEYYRLPGFPGSFEASPSSKTVYRYTSKNINGTGATSRAASFINREIPYEIKVSEDTLDLDTAVLGDNCHVASLDDDAQAKIINLRENRLDSIALEDAQKNNAVIIENLGIDSNLSNAIINNYALLETEIKEDGSDGEENNIGVVSTYQQQYRGIPLEDNFFTVCSDSDGVFSVIDRWSEISEIDSSQIIEPITIRKAEEILDSKLNFKAPEIDSCEYVYKKTENGTYRLSVKLVLENNQQYYVDAVSGDLETVEIE